MNNYYYLGNEQFVTKDDKTLIKVYVLDMKNKIVHIIYKTFTKEFIEKINSFKIFDNITNLIGFVIKRNGTISLDIK